MKVRLVVTVEVDPALWQAEYGVRSDETRDDVRRYFEAYLVEAPAVEFAGLEVTVR